MDRTTQTTLSAIITLNNTNQVRIFYSMNVWDYGYPSGGNYWSDYNGTDLFSGKSQNETGSDGIGDAPYFIDADNTDRYPLMGAFQNFAVHTYPTSIQQPIEIISNSTVTNLDLCIWLSSPYNGLQPEQPFLQFSATGEDGSVGFCRLMIPKSVLNGSTFVVLVDSNP